MVVVEDVLTDTLSACVRDWFEPNFGHPFLHLQTLSVPDSAKPIPKRWVEDVEIGLDEGFGAEDGDVLGQGLRGAWSMEEGKMRLYDALQRLQLGHGEMGEDHVAHPDLSRMSKHELAAEKRRVKQELKRYDAEFKKQFMRFPTHMEKEPMRPLYVYYRRLKTMILQVEQRAGGRRGTAAGGGSDDEGPRFQARESFGNLDGLDSETPRQNSRRTPVEDQIAALEARVESLQNEKSGVRSMLQAFQEKFVVENNRKIRFHKDILPIEREYRMYKNLKEELMRAEAQLRDLRAEN